LDESGADGGGEDAAEAVDFGQCLEAGAADGAAETGGGKIAGTGEFRCGGGDAHGRGGVARDDHAIGA